MPSVSVLPAGHLQGWGRPGAGFDEVLYFVNSDLQAARLTLPGLQGRPFGLHPVHRSPAAADPRPAQDSSWDADTATVRVPPRTAMVYVRPRPIPAVPYSDASHRR